MKKIIRLYNPADSTYFSGFSIKNGMEWTTNKAYAKYFSNVNNWLDYIQREYSRYVKGAAYRTAPLSQIKSTIDDSYELIKNYKFVTFVLEETELESCDINIDTNSIAGFKVYWRPKLGRELVNLINEKNGIPYALITWKRITISTSWGMRQNRCDYTIFEDLKQIQKKCNIYVKSSIYDSATWVWKQSDLLLVKTTLGEKVEDVLIFNKP